MYLAVTPPLVVGLSFGTPSGLLLEPPHDLYVSNVEWCPVRRAKEGRDVFLRESFVWRTDEDLKDPVH